MGDMVPLRDLGRGDARFRHDPRLPYRDQSARRRGGMPARARVRARDVLDLGADRAHGQRRRRACRPSDLPPFSRLSSRAICWFPIATMPGWLQAFVKVNPMSDLANGHPRATCRRPGRCGRAEVGAMGPGHRRGVRAARGPCLPAAHLALPQRRPHSERGEVGVEPPPAACQNQRRPHSGAESAAVAACGSAPRTRQATRPTQIGHPPSTEPAGRSRRNGREARRNGRAKREGQARLLPRHEPVARGRCPVAGSCGGALGRGLDGGGRSGSGYPGETADSVPVFPRHGEDEQRDHGPGPVGERVGVPRRRRAVRDPGRGN